MKITLIPIEDLKPYGKNAKKHPKGQIEAIARSIKEFGFNQPVVVDKNNSVIVGHGRMLAAIQLKMYDVPAIKATDLTDAQIKAYRLADNKLNESDWDMDLVIEELKELKLEGLDITITGFDDDLTIETKEDDDALGEAMGTIEPIVKVGDLWRLGDHLLYCGDATEKKSYDRLLGKDRARMIFTDPPYGIKYQDSDGEGIMNDDKKDAALVKFFQDALKQIHAYSANDATLYWWYSERFTAENLEAWGGAGWKWSQTVHWLKNGPTWAPSLLYQRLSEPCMVGWKKDKKHYQDLAFSKFTELWDLPKARFAQHLDWWYEKRDDPKTYIHPTQKPVQLSERAIKRSSEKGDIVLDVFCGSGSSLIACEQLGRKGRAMELDPKFCDRIIKRWENLTKKTAKKLK